MSGHRLRITILVALVLTVGLLMVVLNFYPSWSQYARSVFESLLFITLASIFAAFWDRASHHPERERILFKIFGIKIRMEHLDRFIAIMFVLVLATPVTLKGMVIPHFIATGLGAAGSFFHLIFYYRTGVKLIGNIIGALVGVAAFLVGLLTDIYPTGVGELIFAGIMGIHILSTNKIYPDFN